LKDEAIMVKFGTCGQHRRLPTHAKFHWSVRGCRYEEPQKFQKTCWLGFFASQGKRR